MVSTTKRRLMSFWLESRIHLIEFSLSMLWRLPLAVLFGAFLTRLLQCYISSQELQDLACADLSNPIGIFLRSVNAAPIVLISYVLLVLGMIYAEWDQFCKDKPSYFTHGTWNREGYRGTTTRQKELRQEKLSIAKKQIDVQHFDEAHSRIQGAFTDGDVKTYVKRFAGWWNKPKLKDQYCIRWEILIRNGNEVHIQLERDIKRVGIWRMRTQFLEWAGRANPALLKQEHLMEFLPENTDASPD